MEEEWFLYSLAEGKLHNDTSKELQEGDVILVSGRVIAWFDSDYFDYLRGNYIPGNYGFRVKKLKDNSVLSVSVDGELRISQK